MLIWQHKEDKNKIAIGTSQWTNGKDSVEIIEHVVIDFETKEVTTSVCSKKYFQEVFENVGMATDKHPWRLR